MGDFSISVSAESSEATFLQAEDKKIDFTYTDDNSNENLIIKTDEKTYFGLTQAEIYFSVTNIGDKSELVNLQVYFPEDKGEVKKIEKWTENHWQELKLSDNSIPDNRNFFEEFFDLGIERKPIPQNFKVEKSTGQQGYEIESGQTKYFKMIMAFPPNSSSEFYIEAIGDKKGYGLLDPWWNSSWTFRKQITIDHDRVGFISDLSSNANSGQNQIAVKDGNLFAATETIVIKDDNHEETGTISSVSVNTLTMQSNLTNNYTTAANAFVKNTTDSVNLSDFPVLINLSSDTDLAADAQDDGDDIAFTSPSETTRIDHEIESFNGTTGELQAWVEVPTLSVSSDTVIYMYYGNSTCGSQENVSGTWGSNYKLVHHLDDWTTSTTEDSTSNNNDATKGAANEPIETDGKIGKAQSFDGTDDYDKITDVVISSPTSLTISAWIKKEDRGIGTYECALHHSSNYTIGNSSYWLGVDNGNYLTATIGAYNNSSVSWSAGRITPLTEAEATYGQWYYLVASWNGNDSLVRVYLDGVYNKEYSLASYNNLLTPTRFGASSDGSDYQFGGVVDEVRISEAYRGADWIKTSYNNQNSPSSFYSLGAEVEAIPVTLHNVPFDNEEMSDTTPDFEFTAEDPCGTLELVYQIEWDDNISFSSPTTKTSDTDAGFVNTENGSDTSPFTENQRIRFTVQAGDALSNNAANTAYYWRVRAKVNAGIFGAWTDINSLRVDSSLSISQWNQTTDEQFDTGTLSDTKTSSSDDVELATGNDIKSACGTFTTPSSTGNQTITGVGFTPKAIMLYAVPRTNESVGSNAGISMGFSDGTRHRVSAIKSVDGVDDNGRTQNNSYVLNLRDPASETGCLARATVSSFNSDGFILNYNVANSGYVIHYVAFGGDDLTAYVGNKIVSGSPLTGLSFEPEILFTTSAGFSTGNDNQHSIHDFGVIDKDSYWHRGSSQGSNNTIKDSWLTQTGVSSQTYNNGVTWQMTGCALTSDGMSWSGTNTDHFQYLALNLSGNKTKVGVFSKETTGVENVAQDLTGLGFTADAAIMGFCSVGKVNQTRGAHCMYTHGSYDGTNQESVSVGDADVSSVSKSIQNNDKAIPIVNTDAAVQAGGTASLLDNDGVKINWNPNNTSAYVIGYWAIEGGSALASSGSIISPEMDYDWVSGASSWDELSWNDVETNGDIKYQFQYWDGDSWELIPNGSLAGNSTGFDTSPVDLSGLNTTTYNQIKIKANFTNSGGSPILQDWATTWVEAGTLSVDIVDAAGDPVASPSITMGAQTFSFNYQTSTGIFGISTEKIRVDNETASPAWSLAIAASNGVTTAWSNAGGTEKYDFNDPTANAGDGSDDDSYGGQMTIDPSGATITSKSGCSNTDLNLGSSASFSESGSINSITLLTAGSSAGTSCYWDLTSVSISQTIPASQSVDTYTLDFTLTITAQ